MHRLYQWLRNFLLGKPLEIRLVEACAAVKSLRKNGTHDELGFDYLRIMDLANELREQLLPRGIVLIPNDLECIEEISGESVEARVKTEFTVTDGRRELKICSYGFAKDENGYAVAIAQTAGLKALLKRLSLIYGEEDDPETPKWVRHERKRVGQYQERALNSAILNSGRTREQVEALISKGIGKDVTVADIASLPREGFEVAMKILTHESDLTEVLEQSRAALKKEPQKIA